ncbi:MULTISPECIES: MerR family transcriptional regulator [unclassified Rhodococcus (in: high G+C Gram-positive bacteria)]|uniref:MerR family transcriptional regulator n=1 Tax=unclassified Rhodococcus (in: high G+C Gram-positive bacteria) TaxID=192944 RepID=UPI00163B4E46|nr:MULTISPECIES: MerR family transcriptional regulator [unclassified Rhodococcus (in: high G+C Gram-positive bacteria)]MBC2644485.1 MerR family transcriptional regulator [Rhodococcus sp. 3A]MBC2897827.1 MerR family transcriptional regulator [Rhodococcus sp. 4CII]
MAGEPERGPVHDPESPSLRGVYGISVAAELSGFGIAALRLYENYGLITPGRTGGGTRRYSDFDLARLRRIAELIDAGVNLVGIGRVLDLEHRTGELERDNRRLAADNAHLRAERGPAPAGVEDDADRDRPAGFAPPRQTRRRPAPGERSRLRDGPACSRGSDEREHH